MKLWLTYVEILELTVAFQCLCVQKEVGELVRRGSGWGTRRYV